MLRASCFVQIALFHNVCAFARIFSWSVLKSIRQTSSRSTHRRVVSASVWSHNLRSNRLAPDVRATYSVALALRLSRQQHVGVSSHLASRRAISSKLFQFRVGGHDDAALIHAHRHRQGRGFLPPRRGKGTLMCRSSGLDRRNLARERQIYAYIND